MASTIPAAPSVCPVRPLVELQGVDDPNSASQAAAYSSVIAAASPQRIAALVRMFAVVSVG